MTEIVPFDYSGHPVRTVEIGSEAWFIAADVCAILEIGNPSQALSYLDDDEKTQVRASLISNETWHGSDPLAVNEAGLYSLILRSRKPEAKAFKRWVTHEVLPSLRKTGSYTVEKLSPRDLAVLIIKEADRADRAEHKVAELQPAAEFADDLTSLDGSWSVGNAAKLLSNDPGIGKIGQQRLFQRMFNMGWIFRREGRWTAKQDQVNLGRLCHKVYDPRYDEEHDRLVDREPQVRITWKGLRYLHQKLGGQRPLALNIEPDVEPDKALAATAGGAK